MRWRNPKEEVPNDKQAVWVMTEPHKDRGTLAESRESIEIVCGECHHYPELGEIIVENYDERGYGSEAWVIKAEDSTFPDAMAWMPVEEMPMPTWRK